MHVSTSNDKYHLTLTLRYNVSLNYEFEEKIWIIQLRASQNYPV